eukprot:m.151838 g.151838  ORF g.151838 m.151838 type:complete len:355 (-) comp16347_c0_seq2:123-1187(-)
MAECRRRMRLHSIFHRLCCLALLTTATLACIHSTDLPVDVATATSPLPRPNDCRASFFILGTRKAGTASLYNYIVKHPQVRPLLPIRCQGRRHKSAVVCLYHHKHVYVAVSLSPELCEPNALSELHNYTLAQYQEEFASDLRTDEITGEKSVSYLPSVTAPLKLKEWCGDDVRLIVVLRDPMPRMFSQFHMRKRLHTLPRSQSFLQFAVSQLKAFQAAERAQPNWYQSNTMLFKPAANAIFEGLYAVHLERWLHHYPRTQFKIVFYEELFRSHDTVAGGLQEIFAFLGVQPMSPPLLNETLSHRYNTQTPGQATNPLSFDAPVLQVIQRIYNRYNSVLEEVLGRALPCAWHQPK